MLLLSSLEVSLPWKHSIVSAFLLAFKYAASIYQYWPFFQQRWFGILDVSINIKKTVLECVAARKIHGAAVVVNSCQQSNSSSLVYMLKRSEKKMNLTMIIQERELYSQLQPIWIPRWNKWTQTADLPLVHKEEAQYLKEAWQPKVLLPKTSTHLELRNS